MHPIYERLIELVEQDPNNLEELEDFLEEANEIASTDESDALKLAINHARKERLLVELGKHLLGVNEEVEEEDDEPNDRYSWGSPERMKELQRVVFEYQKQKLEEEGKLRLSRTEYEILQQRIRDQA